LTFAQGAPTYSATPRQQIPEKKPLEMQITGKSGETLKQDIRKLNEKHE